MKEEKNTIALVGMILSICSFITCGLTSIVGLILSIIGAVKSKKLNGDGKTYSIVGIIVSVFMMFIMIIVALALVVVYNTTKVIPKVNTYIDEKIKEEEKNDDYNLDETFYFDGFEIKLSSNYEVIKKENEDTYLIKIPVSIKNTLYNDAKFNMEYCDITGPYKERLESQGSNYKEDSLDLADTIKSNEEVNKYLYIPYKEDGEYEIEFDNHFDDVSIEIFVENKNIN